uniref:Uncharacterized protein n=1 Tax=Knipowitschia caucasica TaxID=637954 RepID=A0AAV2MP44_KNICA
MQSGANRIKMVPNIIWTFENPTAGTRAPPASGPENTSLLCARAGDQMEQRLEDTLSRIALETQEIKELEQQLTNGQHLANLALRKDLWDVISGLQQFYTSVSEGSMASQDSDLDLSSPSPTCAGGSCLCQKDRHNKTSKTNHSQVDPGTRLCSAPVGPADGTHRRTDRLRSETEKLQRALRRHRRVLGVCEEVWCVEQTLLKRRAELRQAQRLLQEVHGSTAQAQSEAEMWQRRTKDSVTSLQQTQLQLRELQDEAETLRTSRGAQIQKQSPDHNPVCSHCLDRLASPRNQDKLLQQRTQELRDQETRLKTSLQLMVQQQEALLSQSSSLISATAAEEEQLQHLRSELDSTRTELKQLQEEVLSERQELKRLKTLQSEKIQKIQKIQVQLVQTQADLDQTKGLRDHTKDEAELTREELNQSRDQLHQTKSELLKTQNAVKQKEESVKEELRNLDQSQAAVERRTEQEVEMRRKEAEAGLKETEEKLKEMKEEVERTKAQNSSLQQQCRHLEDRRKHAHRCLSAVELELQKLKQEHSQSLLTQQQVRQEAATNQEKLNESSELLSFLGEKLEERKIQLQISEQELAILSEKHKQKHTELLELEHKAQSQVQLTQTLASETESKNMRKHLTQEQLHKLSQDNHETQNHSHAL